MAEAIFKGLINKKLVQRIKDPEDSRVSLISLTPTGQKKLNDINAFLELVHHQVLMQMAPDQRQAVLTNLDILKASMEAVKEMMVWNLYFVDEKSDYLIEFAVGFQAYIFYI